ncbi:MAG: 50S ribosomal protein L11 methyltransferase [Proteobacteria bacterium]|nr:50S ribosomal protein L11 methyltransferase [Pseudomonadota bacterium]
MKWIEIKVVFEPKEHVLVEELIASVFEDANTGGVAVERPDMEPLEGWDPGPVSKPDLYCVKGYIPADDKAEAACRIIEQGIAGLKSQGLDLELIYGSLADEDWSETWKEYFRPEKIGKHIVVKPTWRDYQPSSGEIVLEIDPGMAFGTGTHPTTSMCVQLIETHLKPGDSFLDIGTGSGILMIAAAKLGAGHLTGTDFDPVAVETAEKNLVLNNIPGERFQLITGHLSGQVKKRFPLVAANILADVILELLDDLGSIMEENGIFICSGILEEKADRVALKMKEKGFKVAVIIKKDAWAAIAGHYIGSTR